MVHVVYGASDEVMSRAIPLFKANPGGWFGPYYVGTTVDAFFLGILSCQVSRYFSYYSKDSVWNKALVVTCVVLSVFKGVQSFCAVWDRNIVWFGDYQRAAAVHWALYTEPLTMVLLATAAQSYFTWRCFNLTGRNWALLLFLVSSILTSLVLGILVTLQLALDPLYLPGIERPGIPLLVLGLVVDITITTTVLYKLVKSRGGVNKTADAFLKNWVVITCQSALPPVLSQVANLLVFAIASQKNGWYGLCNMVTPRLYVFSLLYTLNSRKDSSEIYLEAYKSSTAGAETWASNPKRKRPERNDTATLSAFNARLPTFVTETSGSYSLEDAPPT